MTNQEYNTIKSFVVRNQIGATVFFILCFYLIVFGFENNVDIFISFILFVPFISLFEHRTSFLKINSQYITKKRFRFETIFTILCIIISTINAFYTGFIHDGPYREISLPLLMLIIVVWICKLLTGDKLRKIILSYSSDGL